MNFAKEENPQSRTLAGPCSNFFGNSSDARTICNPLCNAYNKTYLRRHDKNTIQKMKKKYFFTCRNYDFEDHRLIIVLYFVFAKTTKKKNPI